MDPTQLAVAGEDTVEAHAAQMLIGRISKVLLGADELRNARGTGHGRSGGPEVDPALARLAVGAVLPALIYLVGLYEERTEPDSVATFPLPSSTAAPPLQTDAVVRHASFGEGVVRLVTGEADNVVVAVDFGGQVGIKNLLVRYAGLEVVR